MIAIFPLHPIITVMLGDHMQREFLDLGQQLSLRFSETDPFLLNLGLSGDARQMVVLMDVGSNLSQRFEPVLWAKDIVRPTSIDDHFLPLYGPVDG